MLAAGVEESGPVVEPDSLGEAGVGDVGVGTWPAVEEAGSGAGAPGEVVGRREIEWIESAVVGL